MPKPRSKKFWIIFWVISAVFLFGWAAFWQYKEKGISSLATIVNMMPISGEKKNDYRALLKLADYLERKDGKTKTFLVLFQNNLEIRPGGGHLGTFGEIKVRNGLITSIATHDLSNYDKTVKSKMEPPYPLEEILGLKSWKMRDANFSPDFEINAQKTDELYHQGEGKENFDGVIAINSDILASLLKVTGPVELPDFPGVYNSENAILALEYQVEQGYLEQGIEKEDRKSVMNALAEAILEKVHTFTFRQKLQLARIIVGDLDNKSIQLFFKDPELEKSVSSAGWAGLVDKDWNRDYLMMVDANIGAWKSDYYMTRSFEYIVDMTKKPASAELKITYRHGGKVRDWMTKNYLTYLRVYVPDGSWLVKDENFSETRFGSEFGKKYFGALVWVPLGREKTVILKYNLPEKIKDGDYDLLIQKQSGIAAIPGQVTIIDEDGRKTEKTVEITRDFILNK